MTPLPKFAIGLGAALLVGWVSHGPMGRGEAFIGTLEQRAQRIVSATEIEGVSLRMGRAPLSRVAYLSGPADRFQREGLGSFPGIDRRIGRVPGVARVVWTNPPPDERN